MIKRAAVFVDSSLKIAGQGELMKSPWYAGTFISGLIGILSLLRFLEMQLLVGTFQPFALINAIVFLAIAYACLKKARAS